MKSLVQYITEHLNINEGGNAVQCERIPSEVAMKLYTDIVDRIHSKYRNIETRVLGSVGKKRAGDTNGDIDIAIKMDSKEDLKRIVDELFPECEQSMQGFGISIGYKYDYKGQQKIGQVDFMLQDDLDWAEFYYHSPNYIENESQFKGAIRTNFLSIIVTSVPTEEDPEMDGDQYVTRWKYTSNSSGIWKQFLDYRGKKGLLKNPKKIKELEKLITKNKEELAQMLFHKPNIKDFNSAETLWKAVHSNNFKYPQMLPQIEERFKTEVLSTINFDYEAFLNIVK